MPLVIVGYGCSVPMYLPDKPPVETRPHLDDTAFACLDSLDRLGYHVVARRCLRAAMASLPLSLIVKAQLIGRLAEPDPVFDPLRDYANEPVDDGHEVWTIPNAQARVRTWGNPYRKRW